MPADRVTDAPNPAPTATLVQAVRGVVHGRKNTTPRRLIAPGPSGPQLDELLAAAAAAPDHGKLTPWRFILIPEDRRDALARVFRQALQERDPQATAEQVDAAGEKAGRSPTLLLAVADLSKRDPDIPADERLVSLGCAIQNMLLMAEAMGYGSGLASGQAMHSRALREAFGLSAGERAVCFVSFGTVAHDKPTKPRAAPGAFFSVFEG